jgi:hypothetical protein
MHSACSLPVIVRCKSLEAGVDVDNDGDGSDKLLSKTTKLTQLTLEALDRHAVFGDGSSGVSGMITSDGATSISMTAGTSTAGGAA